MATMNHNERDIISSLAGELLGAAQVLYGLTLLRADHNGLAEGEWWLANVILDRATELSAICEPVNSSSE